MTLNPALLTSVRPDWRTPRDLYARFVGPTADPPCFDVSDRHEGGFEFDALTFVWPYPWYCNPPYGRGIIAWVRRMRGSGVALLPARTNTAWGQQVLREASTVLFLKGRLHFDDGPHAAPFPSMLAFYGDYPAWKLADILEGVWVVSGATDRDSTEHGP